MGRQNNNKKATNQNTSLTLVPFDALTAGQKAVADRFDEYEVLSLRGMPGTGKTFWALYLACQRVFTRNSQYEKIVVVRSTVSTRDPGFLPGNLGEKNHPYEGPYYGHFKKIFGRPDAYEILCKRGIIEFVSTAFLRGTEWNNAIVIVDEPQNMADNELHTINTRFGENCKLVFCGDTGQDDLTNERFKEVSGYADMNRVLDSITECHFGVVFGIDDIIRSGYIKDYLIARQAILNR